MNFILFFYFSISAFNLTLLKENQTTDGIPRIPLNIPGNLLSCLNTMLTEKTNIDRNRTYIGLGPQSKVTPPWLRSIKRRKIHPPLYLETYSLIV